MFGVDYSKALANIFNVGEASDFGTAFMFGDTMVIIGMVAIFAVLCIIWLALVIFKYVFHDLAEKKAADPVEEAPVAVAPVAPVRDDSEIIVAIAAAIAAAESENQGLKFKVVSFKRK